MDERRAGAAFAAVVVAAGLIAAPDQAPAMPAAPAPVPEATATEAPVPETSASETRATEAPAPEMPASEAPGTESAVPEVTGAEVAAAPRATVRTGAGGWLNVRRNTATWHQPVGRLRNGAKVNAKCQLGGERFAGTARSTAVWLKLGANRYVSDAYVSWRPSRPDLRWCNMPRKAAPSGQAAFIRWAAKRARASHERYQVPISVTVAQAINESGWGRSSLTTEGNAYFGIKCFGTPGPVATGCRPYRTSECEADDCFSTTGTFRVYRKPARSFKDHGRFLTVNPRYRNAFNYTDRPNRFTREIHKAGYATDPNYSDKLISLMREFNLYRFDR